jgi:PIN domain nuclease of toxin-antitoxin system
MGRLSAGEHLVPDYVTGTHALVWYLEDSPRLGNIARRVFDECERGEATIYVPAITLVEILYLQEKGRISADLKDRFDDVLTSGTSGLVVAR